jgi:hypothetical protein
MLIRVGVPAGTEGSINAECGHTKFVSTVAQMQDLDPLKDNQNLTRRLASLTIPKLEQNHIVPIHGFLVEPTLIGVIQHLVRLVSVVWEDDISSYQVCFWIEATIITEGERVVLVRRGDWSPDAIYDEKFI